MFEQYPEIMTKEQIAEILQCRPAAIYEATRSRSRVRHTNPIPFIKLPCGLRFRKVDILSWLAELATEGAQ